MRHRCAEQTLAFVGFALSMAGCASMRFAASPEHAALVDDFPFRAERPIAREIRYVYVSATQLGDDPGRPLVAVDPATSADLPEGTPVISLAVQPLADGSQGTRWSEIYSQKAAEARRLGRTGDVQLYTGLSMSALQTEQAMGRMASGVTTALAAWQGSLLLMGAIAQAGVEGTATALTNWIVDNTAAIGPQAPEGSVLTLRLYHVHKGEKWKSEGRMDFVVVAILADGDGRTLQSTRSWQMWLLKQEGSELEIPRDALPHDPARVVPQGNEAAFGPASKKAWAAPLALAANAAIADLCERLEELSARPATPRER